jgi:hypothetical protein
VEHSPKSGNLEAHDGPLQISFAAPQASLGSLLNECCLRYPRDAKEAPKYVECGYDEL